MGQNCCKDDLNSGTPSTFTIRLICYKCERLSLWKCINCSFIPKYLYVPLHLSSVIITWDVCNKVLESLGNIWPLSLRIWRSWFIDDWVQLFSTAHFANFSVKSQCSFTSLSDFGESFSIVPSRSKTSSRSCCCGWTMDYHQLKAWQYHCHYYWDYCKIILHPVSHSAAPLFSCIFYNTTFFPKKHWKLVDLLMRREGGTGHPLALPTVRNSNFTSDQHR